MALVSAHFGGLSRSDFQILIQLFQNFQHQGLEHAALGVSVLMTGMPAGATAAIFAERYHSDAPFATRCVVASTLFSMLTLPMWCAIMQ